MTFDGAPTNFRTLELMGCKFNGNLENLKVSFKHPTRDYEVFATPDACHMLKLARNALGELGTFLDSNDRTISWNPICQLSTLQDDEGFYLANKLKQ